MEKQKKRKIIHSESNSLWNYTLSPGWTREEVTILKKVLSKCLPGKSTGQIYIQTQRLIGQQSLGEFVGLQVDLERIFQDNMKKTDAKRKNNCIINTGDNPTKEERQRRIKENKKKYGLTIEEVKNIKLPRIKNNSDYDLYTLEEIETDRFPTIEKINQLQKLKNAIEKKLKKMDPKLMDENYVESNKNTQNQQKINKKVKKNNENNDEGDENINENSNSDSVIINLKKVSEKKYDLEQNLNENEEKSQI